MTPRLLTILLNFLLFLSACGKHPDGAGAASLPPPADEATPSQRSLIDATLTKIELITAGLGQPRKFRAVPVLVTSDNQYLTEAKGSCVRLGDRPQFILVSPAVLKFEAPLPPDALTSSFFPILLHEIGHCYFGRSHDSALIRTQGYDIAMATSAGEQVREERIDSLDASVMAPQKIFMPVALERYYVAEVMGLVPQRSLEAVAKYSAARASLKYVKRDELKP